MKGKFAIPYGAHVILLFFLTFAIFILSILIVFSSPFIPSINFLQLPIEGGGSTSFGSFGWCSPTYCLPSTTGYEYGTQINRSLTGAMVLWVIALIFIFFTLLSTLPLLFVHESKALRYVGNRQFFMICLNISLILVIAAWCFSIYGWSIAHRAFEVAGTEVKLGSAIWMGLAGAICIVIVRYIAWPDDAWDGDNTVATGGVGRGVPASAGDGYYHYKRTTREIVPRY